MSTEPLFDDDAIWLATERACGQMHANWHWMDDEARETARRHMRPRILAAAIVFEEVVRRKFNERATDDAQP